MNFRVGIFTALEYNLVSSPLINSIIYLSQHGYYVDIFAAPSKKFPAPEFDSSKVQYIPVKLPKFRLPWITQILKILIIRRKQRGKKYDFFIGFDPGGLKSAAILGLIRKTPYLYHSLEIYTEEAASKPYQRLQKSFERLLNRFAVFTITQDEVRADILTRENKLDRDKVLSVYNAPMGGVLLEKSSWLRERLKIPDKQCIILGVGSLIEEHMVEEIAKSVSVWPKGVVLVLHGWFPNKVFESKLRYIAKSQPGRIFISTELLPHDRKYLVFQSADIGLAFYKPINDNFRYVGAAAGKIFDFFRCGVPVIANDLPGFDKLIKKAGCGELVKDCSDLGSALQHILKSRDDYSKAAVNSFLKHEFSRNYKPVLNRLEMLFKKNKEPIS